MTLDDLDAIAGRRVRVELSPAARRVMTASRRTVERAVAKGERIYGITTGFGRFADVAIPPDQLTELQRNLVRSHAAGVGNLLPDGAVRAMMALRANALASGRSGIRVATVQTLLDMLRADILPAVPEKGSVGASGDLAPLAHLALALIGEGSVRRSGHTVPAARAFRDAKLRPATLAAKEGLALVNGVQMSVAVGGLARDPPGTRGRPRRVRVGGRGAGIRRGLRPAGDRGAAPSRSGRKRAQPEEAARGQRDPGVAPGLRQGPGQLRAAVHAAGSRRGAGCVRARPRGPGARDEQRDGQPPRVRGERGRRLGRQLPRRAGGPRPRLRGD